MKVCYNTMRGFPLWCWVCPLTSVCIVWLGFQPHAEVSRPMDIVKLVLDTRVPIARALNALCIDSDPNERQSLRKRAYKELNAPISTDHGNLFCKLNVTNDLGESYALSCINPMALLVAGSSVCHVFFLMLATLMEQTHGEPLRCTVYHDGVTPGNNLRPDHGRKFESF